MKQDVFEPGSVYHIYNRGNNKSDIFFEEKNYNYFIELVKKHLLGICDIYAYCLLKNHFHLLIRIKDYHILPPKIAEKPYQPFSNLFNSYSKSINKMYDRTGSLFQEHLKRIRVSDEKYFTQLIAYIHLNPLKHHFSDSFENYPFSSYKDYLNNNHSIINNEFVYSILGDKENFLYWHDERKLTSQIIQSIEEEDE